MEASREEKRTTKKQRVGCYTHTVQHQAPTLTRALERGDARLHGEGSESKSVKISCAFLAYSAARIYATFWRKKMQCLTGNF